MAVRIGVDAGGTFTDVCLTTDRGELGVYKLSSSPRDPSEAIAGGVAAILSQEGRPLNPSRTSVMAQPSRRTPCSRGAARGPAS